MRCDEPPASPPLKLPRLSATIILMVPTITQPPPGNTGAKPTREVAVTTTRQGAVVGKNAPGNVTVRRRSMPVVKADEISCSGTAREASPARRGSLIRRRRSGDFSLPVRYKVRELPEHCKVTCVRITKTCRTVQHPRSTTTATVLVVRNRMRCIITRSLVPPWPSNLARLRTVITHILHHCVTRWIQGGPAFRVSGHAQRCMILSIQQQQFGTCRLSFCVSISIRRARAYPAPHSYGVEWHRPCSRGCVNIGGLL